jgi:hypothetical protein
MKALKNAWLAILVVLFSTLSIAAPAGADAPAATTVTLYSWSSAGWASGWHTHTETPAYDSIHVSWTYRGTSGCNSGSDHFLVRIIGNQYGDVVVHQQSIWGSLTNDSWSGTFVVTEADYGWHDNQNYKVSMYVGPQSACSASVRVWEYA